MKKIGILGAGQLGCMLAESLFKFGVEVFFYDTHQDAPGSLRTSHFVCGEWNDEEKLNQFFASCDLVTYEFENVSVELLDSLIHKTKTPLFPSAHVLSTTQNRIYEKNFLKKNSFPVCQFIPIFNKNDLQKTTNLKPFPYIIKTATGGYDGKGQWKINNKKQLNEFLTENDNKDFFPLILEEVIPIYKEVSCITARNKQGHIVCFPVFENEHRDHILYQTLLPAEIPEDISMRVQSIAKEACQKLDVIGLLTTEFFITKNNDIYVNEFAPRPHNSGHITHSACSINQYDMLARILLDLPLHEPLLNKQFYCMGNMLGDIWIKQGHHKNLNLHAWEQNPNIVDVRIYGKNLAVEKRKMGHFIANHTSREKVIAAAEKLRKDLTVEESHESK